jgi:hypothetical protein
MTAVPTCSRSSRIRHCSLYFPPRTACALQGLAGEPVLARGIAERAHCQAPGAIRGHPHRAEAGGRRHRPRASSGGLGPRALEAQAVRGCPRRLGLGLGRGPVPRGLGRGLRRRHRRHLVPHGAVAGLGARPIPEIGLTPPQGNRPASGVLSVFGAMSIGQELGGVLGSGALFVVRAGSASCCET